MEKGAKQVPMRDQANDPPGATVARGAGMGLVRSLLIVLGAGTLIVLANKLRHRRQAAIDVGAVSDDWLLEQRREGPETQ